MKAVLVIPALDCGSTVGRVVTGARQYVETVLVVDDGSSDDTAEKAAVAGAIVLRHERNQGKGVALTAGMHWAQRQGFDGVVTMDGDGQHLSADLPALLAAAGSRPGAIVIGARRIDSANVSPLRLFGNRFANRWVEIACGLALPDTQSGFRYYPIPGALDLRTRSRRFAFETEILIRAARAGIPIDSVWVRVYYAPPGEHTSHYRGFVDTVRIIFVVLGLIFRVW